MRVWRAAPDEAPAVAALLGGFRDHLGYSTPDDASLRRSVERIIAATTPSTSWRASARPRASPGPLPLERLVGAEDCWVEDLYVRAMPAARARRALIDAVLERARERGCRRVELDVNSENPPALALYRSLGFDTGKTGGQDLLMRRRLSASRAAGGLPGHSVRLARTSSRWRTCRSRCVASTCWTFDARTGLSGRGGHGSRESTRVRNS